jgi:hypothetical protein
MRAVVIACAALLAGCSTLTPDGQSASGGGAAYTLQRTEDGACKITLNSSREVSGADVAVDGETCSLTAEVGDMQAIPITPEVLKVLLGR